MRANWFVAIPFPLANLEGLLAHLPESCRGFHQEDLHLTVAFLGAMDPVLQSAVETAMNRIEAAPVEVTLGNPRALPTRRKPSAFCLELARGRDRVASWIGAWRGDLYAAAGSRPDDREPLPHLTIARPRRSQGQLSRSEGLSWLDALRPPDGVFRLDRLALFTWASDRRERLFKRVHEVHFDAG